MAWVELATSGEPYNFESSGNAKVSGSVVFPDGAAARNATWFIELTDPTKRLGFTWVNVDPVALPGGSSLSSPGGLLDINGFALQQYTVSGGLVTTTTVAEDPGNVTPAGSATFSYEPPYVNETFVPPQYNIVVWVEVDGPSPGLETSYNCDCDDDYPRTTLAELRKRLLRRLGFSAQVNRPPPGMPELLDDFIRQAQEMLFRRYSVFRTERFFTWDLVAGTRFYDLDANADECIKKLEPRMITWAGISQGDDSWRPLVCGIDPVMYTSRGPGIPSHYEVRQCIELWPAPLDTTWKLRVKGHFGLLPLEADDDETTIDPEAIFLLALANAKAHYGQPDAGNYASQLTTYVRDLIRGSHQTRRYFPGREDVRNAVQPIPVGGWR